MDEYEIDKIRHLKPEQVGPDTFVLMFILVIVLAAFLFFFAPGITGLRRWLGLVRKGRKSYEDKPNPKKGA